MRPSHIGHRLLAIGLAMLVLGHASTASAAEPGLRVQVDPDTGTYSMPAPAALPAHAAEDEGNAAGATEADDVIITPARSPAGGFKATLRRESELRQEQP